MKGLEITNEKMMSPDLIIPEAGLWDMEVHYNTLRGLHFLYFQNFQIK